MKKQPDDDEAFQANLELMRELVELGELMAKLSPEDFEKEFEELCAVFNPEALRRFLKHDIPWVRALLRKYEQ
jgi:hypothetical protein